MVYNIDFNIASIIICLFIIYYIVIKKALWKNVNRIYLALVISGLFSAIFNIASSIAISYPDKDNLWKQDIWNYLYFGVYNVMPVLVVLYLLCIFRIYNRLSKWQMVLFGTPFAVDVILFLGNPFFHWIFYYDAEGRYLHGGAFAILFVTAFLYLAVAGILLFKYRSMLPNEKWQPLIVFLVLSVVFIVVQQLMPTILIALFFQCMGLLGLLFSIENKDDVMNPITNVYNRYSFLDEVGIAFYGGEASILIIKLSNMGYHNTTTGVKRMNDIRQAIAEWLNSLHKELQCYDCENGHFALIGDNSVQLNDIKEMIFERFSYVWEQDSFKMVLPMQVCEVHIPEDINCMEDLLLVLDSTFTGVESEEIAVSEALNTYQRRILIENKIREALVKKRFQVWYQPIWNRTTERVHSAEALIRLNDEEWGYISPEEFIPIAEQNGMIIEIGAFVFEEVCRFYQEQSLGDIGIDYIEVNLSVVQCMNDRLVNTFENVLKKYKLDAKRINLELTESAAANNRAVLEGTVSELEQRGFTFSLDDYGTGYSNISYMYEMPFSIIKLDKSILWKAISPKNGECNDKAMMFLENTMRMLQEMQYKTLAEGVETSEQKTILEELGCDYFQGCYFSKPMPEHTFLAYVKETNAVLA